MTGNVIEPANRSAGIGLLQICAAGVLWGSGGLVVAVLNERSGLTATTASAWRLTLAAGALVVFAACTGRFRDVTSTMRTQPGTVALAGIGTALYQALYFASVLSIGVGVATVVSLGLAPVLASAWEHLTSRSAPSLREKAVLASALAGLCLVAFGGPSHGDGTGTDPGFGLLLAVAAGATYAATTILGHRLASRVDTVALTTCTTVFGALALVPLFGVAILNTTPILPTDGTSLILLGYLGFFTMALSYGLLYAGLRTTPGSAATVATLVEPISAAILAAVFLGERPTAMSVAGGLLILGAVVALPRRPPTPP